MDIDNWVNRIIKGMGGFLSWETHEFPIYHSSREESIAAFVLRCLANPGCDGSAEVLGEILRHRKSLSTAPEKWPSICEEPAKPETI